MTLLFKGQNKKLVIINELTSEYLQGLGAVNFFLHKRDRSVAQYLSRFFSERGIDARVSNEILFGAMNYNMPHSKRNVIDVLLFGDSDSQKKVFNELDSAINTGTDLPNLPFLSNIISKYEFRRWDSVGNRSEQGVVKGYSVIPKQYWRFLPTEKAQYNLNFMKPELLKK